ncbi:DUF2674 domain-containing protein [Rickettsia typhi]|uniref:DUF2674 domain-containing protein n=2 Tax=Rickettsia typhi TaxID=785 RepID=Q68XL0_RICTY|nr:DUF2674 domain-containing protein [Rickettsia typhi]AAU03632.1 rickettsial conserved hypothetical protein [Rickettsia typhi str. Wilmington]AFE54011.1 hypothetical protein RTTH1527_00720 [Rickettsia typhi str. TH1527]AFE54850.1 hypothetical protein RTB9991CWPP_00725 [Rickettsia typhi str. B9991CWPP]
MQNPTQKVISFSEHKADIERIKKAIEEGWAIVKLVPNKDRFIGLLEKVSDHKDETIYIPPRKKIIVK